MTTAAVFLLCLLLTIQPLSPDGEEPLPLDAYWELVEETHALLVELEGGEPETAHTRLSAAAARWEAVDQLLLPDGTRVVVEHDYLIARLQAEPPDLEGLEAYFESLMLARATWPQSAPPPDEEILEDVLSRPEFQWRAPQPSPLEEAWQRFLLRVREFFARLFPHSERTLRIDGPPLLTLLPLGLSILVLSLVLVYALRGVLAGFVAESGIEPQVEEGREVLTASAALQRARDLSGAGDYRTAVRYLYLSSLLILEERGVLRYERSLTNREVLRTVAGTPRLANVLENVVEVFDRVWYGYQSLDDEAYRRYEEQVNDLRSFE